MSDLEDKNLIDVEARLEQELNAIPLEPFETMMAELRPKLRKKRIRRTRLNTFVKRVAPIAASIILLLAIGLAALFLWPNGDPPPGPPDYRYEDADIDAIPCEESDVVNYPGLYVPDFDILFKENTFYSVGMHKESQKPVYFIVEGYHSSDDIGRHIVLTIILEKKYRPPKEDQYTTDNTIMVSGKKISVFEGEFEMPFHNYKLGFKVGDVRYYVDYQTTSETNDIESFMQLFLK